MTVHPQLYLTAPSPCPYLENQMERKVFTHLVGEHARAQHEELSQGGFRRSQNIAYRPACEKCRACVATRVLADRFAPTRNMRRIMKRNEDLIGKLVPNLPTSEQYSLFRRYIDSRHGDGGMAGMSVMDYSMMIEDSHVDTQIIEYRKRGIDSGITGEGTGPLIAVSLFDRLNNGLSMVYSFFEPREEKRSLGTYLIIDHIYRARRDGLAYCHLGYLVEDSPKMAYKARFLPQERLTPAGWVEVDG
ncbi:arginyltransferase [Pseudahrensia aquimaris]|uniref:Aspartate/glutamate leucyltransferase n=1 Tax=Pseudahrensia aquimaris TaxID=744461 RepID=A0ABW3FFA6_9HYPH